jgi:hypothetical protein
MGSRLGGKASAFQAEANIVTDADFVTQSELFDMRGWCMLNTLLRRAGTGLLCARSIADGRAEEMPRDSRSCSRSLVTTAISVRPHFPANCGFSEAVNGFLVNGFLFEFPNLIH